MKVHSLLSPAQDLFLKLFSQNNSLSRDFYLTGGTALVEYYIPYRYSEDLDFFSEDEFKIESLLVFIRSNKSHLKYTSFDFNTSFNRNIIFIKSYQSILKIEFTYYPFPPIVKPKRKHGILVDSSLDIAVNKLFTIYQMPRSRDFMDLYMIQKKFHYSTDFLASKAKAKFEWHVDPLKLGSQFLLALELKDYPKLIKPLNENAWQNHFKKEAKKLEKEVFISKK